MSQACKYSDSCELTISHIRCRALCSDATFAAPENKRCDGVAMVVKLQAQVSGLKFYWPMYSLTGLQKEKIFLYFLISVQLNDYKYFCTGRRFDVN